MVIGIPREKKDLESRVGLTPRWVGKLTAQGHVVQIEKGLGVLAGISDEEYEECGAEVLSDTDAIYKTSEMIVKLKDYMSSERELPFQEGQIVVCFFHLGEVEPDMPMLKKLLESKVTGVSLELILDGEGGRICIKPMSEVAGRVGVLMAAQHCMSPFGGAGISLASVPSLEKPKVVILGGGVCGLAAARTALGLGARTVVFEARYDRIEYIQDVLPGAEVLLWDKEICEKQIRDCDVLMNTIYPYPGMPIPLIDRAMVKQMKKQSLIVDLVGCDIIETVRYTTISQPTYTEEGVVHFAVDNLPAYVPRTSCELFAQTIYPYIEAIANKGIKQACEESAGLAGAVSFVDGRLVHKDIAETHGLAYEDLNLSMLGGDA